MGIGNIGWTEFVVILAIALIFFGPRRLPGIANAIGKSLREFQKALNEVKTEISQAAHDAEGGEDVRRILPRPAELMNAHTDTPGTPKTAARPAEPSATKKPKPDSAREGGPGEQTQESEAVADERASQRENEVDDEAPDTAGQRNDEHVARRPPRETEDDADDRDPDNA